MLRYEDLEFYIAFFDGVGKIIGLSNEEDEIVWGTNDNPYDARNLTMEECEKIREWGITKYNDQVLSEIK